MVADGLPAVLGGRVAAVELDAGTVQVGSVFAQQAEPHPLPGPVLAPGIKAGVHALPGQRCARKKPFDRQYPSLTAAFEFVVNVFYQLHRLHDRGPAVCGEGKHGQNPLANHLFRQDFH